MVQKLKYEDVKNFIEIETNSGCELLSKEYINNHSLLEIKCKCGVLFKTSLLKFKTQNKRQCNECGNINKIKNLRKTHREFIKEVYELEGCDYSVLTLYEKANKNIKIKHNKCGCVYEVRPNNFLSGFRCPRCAIQHLDNEFVKSKINDKEFEIVGNYLNSKTKVTIHHNKCGRDFKIHFNKFRNKKICPLCNYEKIIKDRMLNYETIKSEIESKGYKLLSKKYFGADEKLLMICPNGHTISKRWRNFQQDTGCPICKNQVVIRGVNDINTTHKEYLKYFNNINDSYLYSYGSNKIIISKCPDCGSLKKNKNKRPN